MATIEQGQVEIVDKVLEEKIERKRSTSLVHGSAEMMEAKERLYKNRQLFLGAAAGLLTLELRPVNRAAEA